MPASGREIGETKWNVLSWRYRVYLLVGGTSCRVGRRESHVLVPIASGLRELVLRGRALVLPKTKEVALGAHPSDHHTHTFKAHHVRHSTSKWQGLRRFRRQPSALADSKWGVWRTRTIPEAAAEWRTGNTTNMDVQGTGCAPATTSNDSANHNATQLAVTDSPALSTTKKTPSK